MSINLFFQHFEIYFIQIKPFLFCKVIYIYFIIPYPFFSLHIPHPLFTPLFITIIPHPLLFTNSPHYPPSPLALKPIIHPHTSLSPSLSTLIIHFPSSTLIIHSHPSLSTLTPHYTPSSLIFYPHPSLSTLTPYFLPSPLIIHPHPLFSTLTPHYPPSSLIFYPHSSLTPSFPIPLILKIYIKVLLNIYYENFNPFPMH